MSSESLGGQSDSRDTLSFALPALKISLALIGLLILCLLIGLGMSPSSRFLAFVLAIAAAGFMLVKRGPTMDLLHPVRIFGALWCFCLALASMRLLPMIISNWSQLMWGCVLTALVSFISGFWLATRITRKRVSKLGLSAEVVSAEDFLPTTRTMALAGICILIGTSVLAYEDFLIGGIPILSDNTDFLRMQLFGYDANPKFDTLSIKLVHPFVDFLKYGVFLSFIVLFQKNAKSKKVIFVGILIILFGTLAYGSQAGRLFFVIIAVTGAALFHYLRRRIKLVEIAAALLVIFLFVGIFGSTRIEQSHSAPLFKQALEGSSFPDGQFWEGVAFGYATVTVSFEVFYKLTEDLRTMKHPPGGFMFYSLHRFISRASIGDIAKDMYSGESTTTTFLGDFYGDYGYWGVLFGPLIMGFFYGWAYSHAGRQNPMYWIYVRAMLLQMLILCPYVNMFSLYLTWIFDLFFMYLLIHFAASRVRRAPPLPSRSVRDLSPA
jgi:oligosaccharide repeat unit polymerase